MPNQVILRITAYRDNTVEIATDLDLTSEQVAKILRRITDAIENGDVPTVDLR